MTPMPKLKKVTVNSSGAKSGTAPATKTGFWTAQSLFTHYRLEDKGGHISQEFQDYGYRLALSLDDEAHKSLYIKLAKQVPRVILDQALRFVSDAMARSKAKLFMWKLKQLYPATFSGKKAQS